MEDDCFELIHEGYKTPSVEFEIQYCSQNFKFYLGGSSTSLLIGLSN